MMEATMSDKSAYFAKLLEQAERYDDVPRSIGEVVKATHAGVRIRPSACSRQKAPQDLHLTQQRPAQALGEGTVRPYRRCGSRSNVARSGERERRQCSADAGAANAFYHSMKAEGRTDTAKLVGASTVVTVEDSREAHEEAFAEAHSSLPAAHPQRFEAALKRSVFQSHVLADLQEGCRTAPVPLRCFGIQDQPSSSTPAAAVVAHRLCDLLLEFPDAAIGGICWSTLERTYNELYADPLDVHRLGYSSSQEAARALLRNVLPSTGGDVLDEHALKEDEILVAAEVALTPLPGFAASWPSLYGTLCDVVRGFGTQEDTDSNNEARSILLSQLRPLLEKADDATSPNAGAAPARSLLLSQLSPVSQLSHSSLSETGLSFRDLEGNFKKLQKIGHVVKAVIQWRDQRMRCRQAGNAVATPVDAALAPRLELVFNKQLNNLVLRLLDEQDGCSQGSQEVCSQEVKTPPEEQENSAQVSSSKQTRRDLAHICENPFKWVSCAPASDTAPARRADCCTPSSAVPLEPQQCDAPPASPDSGRGPFTSTTVSRPWARPSSRGPAEKRVASGCGPQQRTQSLTPRGRPAQDVRGIGSGAEAGAEIRSRSEPPQHCPPTDVFDDPFEPPPQMDYWPPSLNSTPAALESHYSFCGAGDVEEVKICNAAPDRGKPTGCVRRGRSPARAGTHSDPASDQAETPAQQTEVLADFSTPDPRSPETSAISMGFLPKWYGVEAAETESLVSGGNQFSLGTFSDIDAHDLESSFGSLRQDVGFPFNKLCCPFNFGDAHARRTANRSRSRSVGRPRSLTRPSTEQARDDTLSLTERTESPLGMRSKSEPPTQRLAAEVFDNPFEPPPELERWTPAVWADDCNTNVAAAFTAQAPTTMDHQRFVAAPELLSGMGVLPTAAPVAQAPVVPIPGVDLPAGVALSVAGFQRVRRGRVHLPVRLPGRSMPCAGGAIALISPTLQAAFPKVTF